MTDPINIYADGSFDAASLSGGWAFVVLDCDRQIGSDRGGMVGTSNNTLEVQSVVQAVSWLEREALTDPAIVWTDSAYVVEGCDRWRQIWRGNGWKRVRANTRSRWRPIPDAKLWQELEGLLERNPHVRIRLCKGHVGIFGNEMADAEARAALNGVRVAAP